MLVACPHCHKRNRLPVDRLTESPNCGACGEPLLNGVLALDADALAELISSQTDSTTGESPVAALPVVVDFWAPWCGPCRQFAPTFTAAAKQYAGRLVFAKVDTEAHQSVAVTHQIRSIPTLAVFHRGQSIQRVSGALPASALSQLLEQVLQQIQHR